MFSIIKQIYFVFNNKLTYSQFDGQVYTQTLYLSDEIEIVNTFKPSHNACRDGKISIRDIKTGTGKYILNSGTNIQICAINIEYVDKNTIRVPICYSGGAGSGECNYAIMDYNINKNLWTYKNIGYYYASMYTYPIISRSQYINGFIFEEIIRLIYNIGLIFDEDKNFRNYIKYFYDNNLLKSQKNIPLKYRIYKF